MNTSAPSGLLAYLPLLTPLAVAIVGGWFTSVYKEQEAEANRIESDRLELDRTQRRLIDKAAIAKDYFGYLGAQVDPRLNQAALTVLASLGYDDLVSNLVTYNPTPDSIAVLQALATTGQGDAANRAVGTLEALARTTGDQEVVRAAENALTVKQAVQPPAAAGRIAIVAGADRTLAAANDEVQRLRAEGFEQTTVVKRGDWYRTVVPVEAEQQPRALETIKGVRSSAYSVDLDQWCKDAREGICATAAQ